MTDYTKLHALIQTIINNPQKGSDGENNTAEENKNVDIILIREQNRALRHVLHEYMQHDGQLKEEIAQLSSDLSKTRADRDAYKNMFETTRTRLVDAKGRLGSYVPLETIEETVRKTTDALDATINDYEGKFDRLRELCNYVDNVRHMAEEDINNLRNTLEGFVSRVSLTMPENSYQASIGFKDADVLQDLDPELVSGSIRITRNPEGNGRKNERFLNTR